MSGRIAPASEELRRFYRDRVTWRHSGEERMRFRKAVRMAKLRAPAIVLDIGARDGGLRAFLPPAVTYQGFEIAPEFASDDIRTGDISEGLPFPDGSFDCAFCIEVLEHVPTPFEALREVYRVVKPGGVLVLSVPNPYHIKELIWNVFRIPDRQGHIYSWTRQTMTQLAAMSGFHLEATAGTYFHPPIPMVALLARSIVYRFRRDTAD